MQVTMAVLKDRVMEHLGFHESTDPSIDNDRLVRNINIARAHEWQLLGGPNTSQGTLTFDLVANQPDYPLPEGFRVGDVYINLDAQTSYPLWRRSLSEAVALDDYPLQASSQTPSIYMVRSIGSITDGTPLPSNLYTSFASPMLTIWPTYSTTIVSGVLITGAGPATELVDDAFTPSPLPNSVDWAACLRAAILVSASLPDDVVLKSSIQTLNSLMSELEDVARLEVLELVNSTTWSVVPDSSVRFGPSVESRSRWSGHVTGGIDPALY